MKSFLLILIVLLIAGGATFWLEQTRPEIPTGQEEIITDQVVATTVQQQDIQPVTRMTGRLLPSRQSKLHYEISGSIIEKLVETGEQVTAGDVLLKINNGDFADRLANAEVQLQQEEDLISRDKKLLDLLIRQRKLLQREVDRMEKLGKQSLTSQTRTDEAKRQLLIQRSEEARLRHSVQTASSRLKSHQLAVQQAQRNLDRAVLLAPFSATINAVNVEVGDYVSPNQPVIELVQVEFVDLYIEVSGSLASAVSLRQKVSVNIAGKMIEGQIKTRQPAPDPDTLTHAIKIRLPGKGLFPGQLGEVVLPGEMLAQVKTVPVSAVLREAGKVYVFQLVEDRVQRVSVTVIRQYKNRMIIEGISDDTKIVATDVEMLEDGQSVNIASWE